MRRRPFRLLPLTGELPPPFKTQDHSFGTSHETLVPLDPGSVFSAIEPAVVDSVYGHRHQTCVFTGHYLS